MLSPGGLTREQAVEALKTRCYCGQLYEQHSDPPCPEVPFPVPMVMKPHLRQSTLGEFWQCHLLSRFTTLHESGWHSQPQARGSFFHAWAAKLLRMLETLGVDKLRDEPECNNPRCQHRPNDMLEPGDREYTEGEVCPLCSEGVLMGRALEDVATDLLLDTFRQVDVPDEDRLPIPYGEHFKDLLWIVRKVAKEQTFNIAKLVDVEHRYRAPIYYDNPYGGVVTRIFSGQMDAVFLGATNDHLVVLDWKDTWSIPGPQSMSNEGYFQQRAYALLLMDEHKHINKVTLKEVYPRFSAGESGEDNTRTATITRDRLPSIRRELGIIAEAYDQAVQHGEERPILWYNPSPGGHCNYCPLPHKCPVWDTYEELKDAGPLQTMEEAEEAAGLLTVAKRVAKLMELRVKGFVGKPGPRPVVPVKVDTGVSKGPDKDPDGLIVYEDKRPGLPPGVPIKTAKGQKVYAYVEGVRTERPTEQQIDEALEARERGVPVSAKDLIKTGASTTFRLVELTVPVDSAADALAARVTSDVETAG